MKVIEESYSCSFVKTNSPKIRAKCYKKTPNVNKKNILFTPQTCTSCICLLNVSSDEVDNESLLKNNMKHNSFPNAKKETIVNIKLDHTFNKNLDELVAVIKNKKKFSTSSIMTNENETKQSYETQLEKFKTFTNTEIISDFYDYTENCIRLILDLKPKYTCVMLPKSIKFDKNDHKRIAVFDIDETLIHCTGQVKPGQNKKDVIQVTLPTKKTVSVGINIRPHWKEALDLIKDNYHIVTYTASHSSYADSVLNYLDPNKEYFKYRLYRNHCIEAQVDDKKFYVKDLDIFHNYNLKDIVLIDNSVLSFAYHLDNGIPIVPFYDSEEDNELIILAHYLLKICKYDDLRTANREHIKLDHFIYQAKLDKAEGYESCDKEEEKKEPEVCVVEEKTKMRRVMRKKTQIGMCFKETISDMHKKVIEEK